jgi:hypothetical protein
MFNLLSNWKVYLLSIALIVALSYNGLQRLRIASLESQSQVCNANLAAKNATIQAANVVRIRQQEQLRLREKEATYARVESLKRRDNIMSIEITGGSDGAIAWMIEQAPEFHWVNNIP